MFSNIITHYCLIVTVTGSYCVNATVTPTTCPSGHYCPLNTEFDTQYPCAAGTYYNLTGWLLIGL